MNIEEMIWTFLNKNCCLTAAGAASLMGLLNFKSNFNPQNLDDTFKKEKGFTNETYTEAVNNGDYDHFSTDGAGYGIMQWKSSKEKMSLLMLSKINDQPIDDLKLQLNFLKKNMKKNYNELWDFLKKTNDIDKNVFVLFKKLDNSLSLAELNQIYELSKIFYKEFTGKDWIEIKEGPEITSTEETEKVAFAPVEIVKTDKDETKEKTEKKSMETKIAEIEIETEEEDLLEKEYKERLERSLNEGNTLDEQDKAQGLDNVKNREIEEMKAMEAEREIKQKEFEEKEKEIKEKEKEIEEKEKEIKEKEKEMEEKEKEIEEKERENEEKKKAIENKGKEVEEKEKMFKQKQREVEEKKQAAEQKQKEIKEKESIIEQKQREIEEKEKEIEQKQKEIEEKELKNSEEQNETENTEILQANVEINNNPQYTNGIAAEIANGIWGYDWKKSINNELEKIVKEIQKTIDTPDRYYKVVSGDTLTKIANKFNSTVEKIIAKNSIIYPTITKSHLEVGWILRI